MKISLKTKVIIFVILIILLVSGVSTYLSISSQSKNMQNEFIAKGNTLSYLLARIATKGLADEDLELLKISEHVVHAEDVKFVQVFTSQWDTIDAYPFERLRDLPDPEAVEHFKKTTDGFHKIFSDEYDFYRPVLFKSFESSPEVIIGYARVVLSNERFEKTIKKLILSNSLFSLIATLISFFSLSIIIDKFLLKPLLSLHKTVSSFKDGIQPENTPVVLNDEISELRREFIDMSIAVKEKEEKLIESEEKIRSLFERVDHAIFRLDKDCNLIETNRAFFNMFGTANNFFSLFNNPAKVTDCLSKAVNNKVVKFEDTLTGKDGSELMVFLSLYSDVDDKGGITGYDGYLIDITFRKKLEERLLRAQKMEAVGTLAGGIAHDFNNILTAVLGYAELIKTTLDTADPLWEYADIIEKSAVKGGLLSSRILNVTRKQPVKLEPININTVVRETVEMLKSTIPKNINIVSTLDESAPFIKADSAQIQQVIMNLAINAKDAMPDGGTLRIETVREKSEHDVTDKIIKGSSLVKLSVKDTGNGIDKETQEKMFDPFYTTKLLGDGTGLGLYIVDSIVERHDGYISIHSELNKGTIFQIYFPECKDVPFKKEDAGIESLKGNGSILVIDDDPLIRKLAVDLLSIYGYKVITASDGYEGIRIFREMKDSISAVLLDMIMPKINGYETFKELKAIDTDVKVVICSGYDQEGLALVKELISLGAKGFIQKPFTMKTIASTIQKTLS